jgi:NAD(P)-dependent dehydrogenase (short-subunit alcohol dehydrogenase family)
MSKKLIDTTEEEWDITLNINLKGSYLFSQELFGTRLKTTIHVFKTLLSLFCVMAIRTARV